MVGVAIVKYAWNDYWLLSGVAASLPGKTQFSYCVYNPILGKPTQLLLPKNAYSFKMSLSQFQQKTVVIEEGSAQ